MPEIDILTIFKELGTNGALVFLLWHVVRWKTREVKGKRNGHSANGNGQRRRITDAQPGNPGHSPYEVLAERIDLLETRTYELGQAIARIQGQLAQK